MKKSRNKDEFFSFNVGRLLGKGAFGKVYEMTNEQGDRYAIKVYPKSVYSKKKYKLRREVNINKMLDHPNIVKFFNYFEDETYYYLIFELCNQETLRSVLKRRKRLMEEEVRYFMFHIINGIEYIHSKNIIHRDLKLDNLLLNDMTVKIGDMGLSTTVQNITEKKLSVCGTPNYIAPEVLNKIGHSFPVDIWAIGVLFFTMLVGKPPFETSKVDSTYEKVLSNDFQFPEDIKISSDAESIVRLILNSDPNTRPTLADIKNHAFFSHDVPLKLPEQSLFEIPNRKNLKRKFEPIKMTKLEQVSPLKKKVKFTTTILGDVKFRLTIIYESIKTFLQVVPTTKPFLDLLANNECPPISQTWIIKWAEYTEKGATAYQMVNGCTGIYFKDKVKIVMSPDKNFVEYYKPCDKNPVTVPLSSIDTLNTKDIARIKMLEMLTNLLKDSKNSFGFENVSDNVIVKKNFYYVINYFKTENGLLFILNNGSIQFNFLHDHSKIVLDMNDNHTTIVYISENKTLEYFYLNSERMVQMCKSDPIFVKKIERLLFYVDKLLSKNK